MFCTKCGHDAGSSKYCGNCGAAVNRDSATDHRSAATRPPTPPIPPPPLSPPPMRPPTVTTPPPTSAQAPRHDTADRLAVTGKVVGLSGCMLALIFWVVIPVAVILVALAASSSEGLAVVAGSIALVVGFIYWVWKRTGQ